MSANSPGVPAGRAKVLLSRIPNVLAVAKREESGTRCRAIHRYFARPVATASTWSLVCRMRLGGSLALPEVRS
jgi:hypothetical protein